MAIRGPNKPASELLPTQVFQGQVTPVPVMTIDTEFSPDMVWQTTRGSDARFTDTLVYDRNTVYHLATMIRSVRVH